MQIRIRDQNDWRILEVVGHIKGSEIAQFRTSVQSALKEGRGRLVADMREVGFIDSSGVGMLITCHQEVKAAGGQLVLTHLSDDIYDLFEMTSIDRLFEIADTDEELAEKTGGSLGNLSQG